MANHRIKVKIGPYEFDAEGDPDAVKQQYADFMTLVSQAPSITPAAPNPVQPPPPAENVGKVDVARVFRQGDPLSLAALPRGDMANADGLLMLIYGYMKVLGEQGVTGTTLMKSAKQSGINVDRIDRALDPRRDLILQAGNKKGLRYSLNNRGEIEAERLMRQLFE
jgi:hypothetical protein